jgi:tetratricopeptide (TPR) repeat protein
MAVVWLTRWADERLASRTAQRPAPLPRAWHRPLVAPTLLLTLAHLVSTAFSVAPRTSLWGSYTRLQGTYTVLSYLVVFGCMLTTLRRREQVERALTTAILTSLPVALYGLVQHYGLDPLPWGGDVIERVASTMGNSIFVGAFLVLVVPVTLARIVALCNTTTDTTSRQRALEIAGLVIAGVLELYALGTLGFWRGLAIALALIVGAVLLAVYLRRPIARFLLLGVYLFVLVVQLLCIFFTQSRGPAIGLLVALFFLGILYLAIRAQRRWIAAYLGIAVALVGLLVVMNAPNSPLAGIRDVPYIGRLGRLLETNTGTGKVRVLLWSAASEMVLASPKRAAVGYGPDAMFVAFTPFYPPDLAHYEQRNASGDRSHNEVFDTLVMTGVLGLAAFAWMAAGIAWYGLKWLGLLEGARQKRSLAFCCGGGALLGIVLPLLIDRSLRYAGVSVLVGFLLGLALHVAIVALARPANTPDAPRSRPLPSPSEYLPLIAVLAALLGHYAELCFGFGVAATRTYFWAFAALLTVLGQHLEPALESATGVGAASVALRSEPRSGTRHGRTQKGKTRTTPKRAVQSSRRDIPLTNVWIAALLTGWALATIAWNYVTNPLPASQTVPAMLARSFGTLAARGEPGTTSPAMALLVLAVWLTGLALTIGHRAANQPSMDARAWLRAAGLYLGVSAALGGVFAAAHASRLLHIIRAETLIDTYLWGGLIVWLVLAALLSTTQPRPPQAASPAVGAGALVLLALAGLLIVNRNVSIVRADVLYKQGLRYEEQSAWDEAISTYRQAIDLAPNEDYYYLFAGRALLARAERETSEQVRDAYYRTALQTLVDAKRINPLNTDHTANMARLHRSWAAVTTDALLRDERLRTAIDHYRAAVQLSPFNAQLYNEWGATLLSSGDLDGALAKYAESLALDQQFAQTYLLIGEVHLTRADYASAAAAYRQATAIEPDRIQAWSSLAYALSQSGEIVPAIDANLRVLALAPGDYITLKNLALLYREAGVPQKAIDAAQQALPLAPTGEQSFLHDLIALEQAKLAAGEAQP